MSQCQDMHQHIIHRTIAPLTQETEERLEAHLLTCPACRQFNRDIIAIEQAGIHVANVRPQPNLKSFLLKQMRHERCLSHKSLLDRIQQALTFRVALYQAAFVFALLMLFVLASPRWKAPRPFSESHFTATIADTVSMNVINLQQIIQIVDSQKVGLNLRQDTVLAKILYTL
jgi:predicted anti-sigma-YlaC factor YlaD